MDKRILIVGTDGLTGRARLGSFVDLHLLVKPGATDVRFEKAPGALADPHHPGVGTWLRIVEGRHTIFLPAPDGRCEMEIVLTPNGQEEGTYGEIVFIDFRPDRQPAANLRFCYSGHRSEAGPEGAKLVRRDVETPADEVIRWV